MKTEPACDVIKRLFYRRGSLEQKQSQERGGAEIKAEGTDEANALGML